MKHSRRGKSHRSRRVRIAGIVIRGLAFVALLFACVGIIRWISGGTRSAGIREASDHSGASLSTFAGLQPSGIQAHNRRLVYPYSVVPGGVTSTAELRQVADHDAVVGEHYRSFDYKHARMIEVNQPRLVYLSYRRGNKVYWTRKQASLQKGEKILTDGKITARARCGNQVSVLPQAQTSTEEPTMAELDRPDAVASGMQAFPSNYESSLLEVDPGVPIGPGGLAAGPVGAPPGGFIPLPVGGAPGTPINSGCVPKPDKPCQNPPPPPPPAVPEPGTIILVASGAAAILTRMRRARG